MILHVLFKLRPKLLAVNLKDIQITGMVLIFVVLTVSCASVQITVAGNHPGEPDVNEKQNCATINSEQKLFCLKLTSNVEPIPVNQIHSWTLQLTNVKGEPVEDANILVYGGMPAHKHGFPTNPQITENLGKGKYTIDGIKFSMPGEWEIWCDIAANGEKDKAFIKIDVS